MTWFLALLVVLLLGATAVVAAGYGGGMAPVHRDRADVLVPEGEITAQDLREVRFSVAFRGYRMDEVDTLLSRLVEQLDAAQRGAVRGDEGPTEGETS